MPSQSKPQQNLMRAAAHTRGGFGGVSQAVGRKFVDADKKMGVKFAEGGYVKGAGPRIKIKDMEPGDWVQNFDPKAQATSDWYLSNPDRAGEFIRPRGPYDPLNRKEEPDVSNTYKRGGKVKSYRKGGTVQAAANGGKLLPGGMEQFSPKNPGAAKKFYDWKDQDWPKNQEEWERPPVKGIDTFHDKDEPDVSGTYRRGGKVKSYANGGYTRGRQEDLDRYTEAVKNIPGYSKDYEPKYVPPLKIGTEPGFNKGGTVMGRQAGAFAQGGPPLGRVGTQGSKKY